MNFSCRDKIDIRICDVFDKDLSDLDRCLHYYILKKLHDLSDLFFWDRRFVLQETMRQSPSTTGRLVVTILAGCSISL